MCNSRYYDALSVGVSILDGIVMTVLAVFGLLTTALIAPLIGIVAGALVLLFIVIAASSLLRQDAQFGACLCRRSIRLLLSALWLIIVSGFTLVFLLTNPIISLILGFLIYTLISYLLFSLYCFLRCLLLAGCDEEDAACVTSAR